MDDGNYIKVSRKILKWGWYKNKNTKVVFLHCLLMANWKNGEFEGGHILFLLSTIYLTLKRSPGCIKKLFGSIPFN